MLLRLCFASFIESYTDMAASRLNADLFTDYRSYKESTGIFVDWLILASNVIDTGQHTLANVGELTRLARIVNQKNQTAPSNVLRSLTNAIKKRRKITAFFAGNLEGGQEVDIDNVTRSHEYFTKTQVAELWSGKF